MVVSYDNFISYIEKNQPLFKKFCSNIEHRSLHFVYKVRQIWKGSDMDREILYNEYVLNNKTRKEISKKYNLSVTQIKYLIKKFNIKKTPPVVDSEKIKELYVVERLSLKEISKLLGISQTAVQNSIRENKIRRRKNINKEVLIQLYNKYNYAKISKMYNVNNATVYRWLKKFGIDTKQGDKNRKETIVKNYYKINKKQFYHEYIINNRTIEDIAKQFNVSNFTLIKYKKDWDIKKDTSAIEKVWLKEQYIDENKSASQIGKENNWTQSKVSYYIQKYGLKKDAESVFASSHNTLKKSGRDWNKSITEDKFCKFIVENFDPDIKQSVVYPENKKWIIDFYSKKYDLWIQFDGDYWHGRFVNERKETERNKRIRKIIEKDKKQIEFIPNLIRVWESDFINDAEKVLERLKNKRNDQRCV